MAALAMSMSQLRAPGARVSGAARGRRVRGARRGRRGGALGVGKPAAGEQVAGRAGVVVAERGVPAAPGRARA